MQLYYKIYDTAKKDYILVPVKVKEGSIIKRFGRQDCTIIPIGGEGELSVDYYSLIIKK